MNFQSIRFCRRVTLPSSHLPVPAEGKVVEVKHQDVYHDHLCAPAPTTSFSVPFHSLTKDEVPPSIKKKRVCHAFGRKGNSPLWFWWGHANHPGASVILASSALRAVRRAGTRSLAR